MVFLSFVAKSHTKRSSLHSEATGIHFTQTRIISSFRRKPYPILTPSVYTIVHLRHQKTYNTYIYIIYIYSDHHFRRQWNSPQNSHSSKLTCKNTETDPHLRYRHIKLKDRQIDNCSLTPCQPRRSYQGDANSRNCTQTPPLNKHTGRDISRNTKDHR